MGEEGERKREGEREGKRREREWRRREGTNILA